MTTRSVRPFSENNAQADRPMALWGGRFSGGPSEALAACRSPPNSIGD